MKPRICVIPARGGSKRVPRKNVRLLAGTPAIAFTIAAARDSGCFDRVVVSTDDEEIASLAREYHADVPFLRQASLADDHTPVVEVVLDAVRRLDPDAVRYDTVGMMMPNCPVRTATDVRECVRHFDDAGARFLLSVAPFGWTNPWWAVELDPASRLARVFPDAWSQRSQDLPELFAPTGAIWLARVREILRERTFMASDTIGHRLTWASGLDIDTEADWGLAETLLAAGRRSA